MAYSFQQRKTYSFNVYPSAILGSGFKNVTVAAILDYQTAKAFGDIEVLHISVFPYLPAGTPNRPQDFDYLLLRTEAGDSIIIGIPWIEEETIEVVGALTMTITIDGVGTEDTERVRACLSQNGYDKFRIELSQAAQLG